MSINLSSSNLSNHQNKDHSKHLNCSIQDNMELLELALKQSIEWSVKNKQNNIARHLKEAATSTIHTKPQEDSHVRAFVSQFKIELNHLIGLKMGSFFEHLNNERTPEESSTTDQESFNSDEDIPFITVQYRNNRNLVKLERVPRIEIDGEYCGLYNINENVDDVDDVESYSRAVEEQVSIQRENYRNREARVVSKKASKFSTCQQVEEDFDGGYGSLNRGSFKASPDLIQQLHDLRSRLIDLVQELDESVEERLSLDQLESYRRRRDALMSKIDSLIDCYDNDQDMESSPVLIGLTDSESNEDNNFGTITNKQSQIDYNLRSKQPRQIVSKKRNKRKGLMNTSINDHEYEEQVHIIDYNRSSTSNSTSFGSKTETEQEIQTGSDLNRVDDLFLSEQANQSDDFIPTKFRPIDFGAMMRNYESNRETRSIEAEPKNPQQVSSDRSLTKPDTSKNTPSSSTTSNSSHISSNSNSSSSSSSSSSFL